MECTNCNSKGCPLNHVCKKIHQAFATNPRRLTTTTTTSNHHHRGRSSAPSAAIEKPSIRVIEIQSKPQPQPPPQHDQHNHHVAFGPSDYNNHGGDHQKSGVHIEDSFGAYIGRVRKKLRTFSTVGGGGEQRNQNRNKHNTTSSSSDYKFTDYISHVKNKFARTLTTAPKTKSHK
ncbi:hypothetical protein LINGRAHAP2_LOCUS17677 [Linum grandiflorum]